MTYTIGIAGGTGSGKTTIAENLVGKFGAHEVTLIAFDNYYHDLSNLSIEERTKNNFDHPRALEVELLIKHLTVLRKGVAIDRPIYNFATHTREEKTVRLEPTPVIVVEGILTLAYPELLPLFDMKIFVDTEADVRFIRRLRRDTAERGRTIESVLKQYQDTVRPMHLEFVEPSKRVADIIIPEGYNDPSLHMLISTVKEHIHS